MRAEPKVAGKAAVEAEHGVAVEAEHGVAVEAEHGVAEAERAAADHSYFANRAGHCSRMGSEQTYG